MSGRPTPSPAPDPAPTEECPRCHHVSEENFRTRCCARCGFGWAGPLEAGDYQPVPARAREPAPRHLVLSVGSGIYRVEMVRGVTRVSGGVFAAPVSLDDLADLLLVLDQAGDELRRRTGVDVAPGGDGGAR